MTLIHDNYAAPLIQRLAEFLEPDSYDTTYLTHGLHPYPAKYIPQLPRAIFEEHTNERNTVLDPFCGSGTTLLEACILGRKSIGIDSNPIATLISRAKTQVLTQDELAEVDHVLVAVKGINANALPEAPVPQIPRLEHWFQPNVVRELAWLRDVITTVAMDRARDLLACVFSSIIVSVSNQESETRYAAVDKQIPNGYALKRFAQKLEQAILAVCELTGIEKACRNTPEVCTRDARMIDAELIPDNSIDLIVTSPPYPNSYDYYLYHKFRMLWLGYDFRVAQSKEIGSRHEHSSKKAPIDAFEEKMLPIMAQLARVLKPSKLAYFFVGDAVIAGSHIDMSSVFRGVGEAAGLSFVTETAYSLERVSRSFHEKRFSSNRLRRNKMQRILVFEGRSSNTTSYSDRAIATPRPARPVIRLQGTIKDGAQVAIDSDDQGRHIHSLGKYPSKFIPDIPRWAITEFSSPGERVLDPFVGAGTTAVEAIIAGRHAISTDVSPYACLLTVAKTTPIDVALLEREARRLSVAVAQPDRLPRGRRPVFDRDTFWFNARHLEEFERVRLFITSRLDQTTQPFFLAVLSTTIKGFSYLDEGQVKVKRDPKKVLAGTPAPSDLLAKRLDGYVARFKEFLAIAGSGLTSSVLNQSAAELQGGQLQPGSVDLVVTSPPYINAMNYPMTHRYENILLRLIDSEEMIRHEMDYFGTERVYSSDYKDLHRVDQSWTASEYLNPRLEQIFQREPKRAFITFRYFVGMRKAFEQIKEIVRPGGRVVLVAGTNVIRGTPIDTFNVLVSLLRDAGLMLSFTFHYEIIKNALKIRRHITANKINMDGIAVFEAP